MSDAHLEQVSRQSLLTLISNVLFQQVKTDDAFVFLQTDVMEVCMKHEMRSKPRRTRGEAFIGPLLTSECFKGILMQVRDRLTLQLRFHG